MERTKIAHLMPLATEDKELKGIDMIIMRIFK